MAIADTIDSIKTHIEDAYGMAEEKGASLPTNKNIQNLADTINNIPSGGGEKFAPFAISFRNYPAKQLDLTNIDFNNITTMDQMFYYSKITNTIDLSKFKNASITSMGETFRGSNTNFTNMQSLNLENCTSFSNCFASYSKSFDLSGMKFKGSLTCMFENAITSFYSLSNDFITSDATSINSMFANAQINTDVFDMSGCDFSNITVCSSFLGYNPQKKQLEKIIFPQNFTMGKITSLDYFLRIGNTDDKLSEIENLEYLQAPKVTSMSYFLNNARSLKKVNLKSLVCTLRSINYMFQNNTSLELIDIRGLTCSGITSSGSYSNALTNVPTTVKIVVKDQTEKTWWQSKFANWSNCFYTLEEAIAQGIVEN